MKKVKNFERFLLDTGLLFEINRQVLHPLGLALAISIDNENEDKVKVDTLFDAREELEGIYYSDEVFNDSIKKFEKYLELPINDKRDENRVEKLGYKVQIK